MHRTYRLMTCSAALLITLAGACTKSSSEQTDPKSETAGESAPGTAGADSTSGKSGADSPPGNAQPGAALVQSGQPSAGGANTVPPTEFEYVEMTVSVDEATGDRKEDNFRYFRVYGELTNRSSSWIDSITGDIRYFDESGTELGVQSVSTAIKEDLGDKSAGERIRSEVSYIAPGATVPVHHIRALAKIGGKYGSHKIALRPAMVITEYPDVAIEDVQDQVANVANEALANRAPKDHRVIAATLRNKGNVGCRNPRLVVGYYDEAGKLADLDSGYVGDHNTVIEPGASASVKVFTIVEYDHAWKAKAKMKSWVKCF